MLRIGFPKALKILILMIGVQGYLAQAKFVQGNLELQSNQVRYSALIRTYS